MSTKGVLGFTAAMTACLAASPAVDAADVAAKPQVVGPEVDLLLFSPDAVYLGTSGYLPASSADPEPLPGKPVGWHTEIYFRLDRKSGALTRATPPADAQGTGPARGVFEGISGSWPSADVSYLGASDGTLYVQSDPSCGQVGNYGRLLSADCRPVEDALSQGESVTAVEDYGAYLLLGTVRFTPAAMPGPGRGLLVLSRKDGKLVRSIGQDDGLPENIIRLVRRDPVTGHLWVETPRTLTEFTSGFQPLRTFYLHIGFGADGVPALLANDGPEYDDPYARLALKLHVRDYASFQQAIQSIPSDQRGKLATDAFVPGRVYDRQPVPAAFGALLPYFTADIAADPDPRQAWFAISNLCRFQDPRARQTANQLLAGPKAPYVRSQVSACADPAVAAAQRPTSPSYGVAPGIGAVAYAAPTAGPALQVMKLAPPVVYWDGKHALHLSDETENYGSGTAGASVTRYYLASVTPVDPTRASVLAERDVPPLASGATSDHSMDVMPPPGLTPGLYYLAACANADKRVPQAYEDGRCLIPYPPIPRNDDP